MHHKYGQELLSNVRVEISDEEMLSVTYDFKWNHCQSSGIQTSKLQLLFLNLWIIPIKYCDLCG